MLITWEKWSELQDKGFVYDMTSGNLCGPDFYYSTVYHSEKGVKVTKKRYTN